MALCLLYALEAFGRERKDLEHFRQQTLKVGEMQEDGNSRIGRANFVEGCATLRPGRELRSQGRWTRCQSGSSDSFQGKNSEPGERGFLKVGDLTPSSSQTSESQTKEGPSAYLSNSAPPLISPPRPTPFAHAKEGWRPAEPTAARRARPASEASEAPLRPARP